MSENNDREEARIILKKITDFNVVNEYYVKEKKEEMVREFKKLLFIDNPVVRHFLEKWINVTKEVAREYDLLGTETEVSNAEDKKTPEEKGQEKDQSEEEEIKEKEQSNEKESSNEEESSNEKESSNEEKAPPIPENFIYESYIKKANDLLIDLLEN